MQKYNQFAIVVLLAVVAFTLGTWKVQPAAAEANPTSSQQESTCDGARAVEVSGAAVVYAYPDRAMLQLGVQSNGTNPDAVRADNQVKIQQVINAIRKLGIDVKDIATDYYLVYPIYDDYSSLVIKGYRLDNTVSITLRDVNLADDALIAALTSGANEVQDVQFYTSELRKYRDQARELAMQAAGEKAEALARKANAQTECLLNISENSWTQYYGSWRGGRTAAMWAQNVIQNASEGEVGVSAGDSPISFGQIAVRAEVSVRYSLD
jgi:uncharacterized protein YggE